MPLNVTGLYQYPNPQAQWLALRVEEVLEPTLPIIDPHHHLWEEPGKCYLAEDLAADLSSGHRIVKTVFVQCHWGYRDTGAEHLRPIGETERVERARRDLAERYPAINACAGIVGFADLRVGALLEEVLQGHMASSPAHFRGVRQSVARDHHFPSGIVVRPAPAGMLADPRFRAGLAVLTRYSLSFDVMLYHEQLPELAALARAAPDARIVLDHVGCPLGIGPYHGREREIFAAWRHDLAQVAACPNVVVKLGGLGMSITGAEFHLRAEPPSSAELARAWGPYFEACIEAFGTKRAMFESNFPVDKAMCSYRTLWNVFKRVAAGASAAEKADLFNQTAARVYRLA